MLHGPTSLKLPAVQRLGVLWEASNPKDFNALLVMHLATGAPVGHLPAKVARHLGPLVRRQEAAVEGIVLAEPTSNSAPLLVKLQVGGMGCCCAGLLGGLESCCGGQLGGL